MKRLRDLVTILLWQSSQFARLPAIWCAFLFKILIEMFANLFTNEVLKLLFVRLRKQNALIFVITDGICLGHKSIIKPSQIPLKQS